MMVERDFREQTVEALAKINATMEGLVKATDDLVSQAREEREHGFTCRQEVDAAIAETREQFLAELAELKVAAAEQVGERKVVGLRVAIIYGAIGIVSSAALGGLFFAIFSGGVHL